MASPPPAPDPAPSIPERTRPRHRGAWLAGGSVSVAAHLFFLFFYGGVAGPPAVSVAPAGEGPSGLQGLELLNLVAQAEDDPNRPDDPDEETELIPMPVAPVAPTEREGAAEAGAGATTERETGPLGPTAADRLQVRVGDRRLWAPLAAEEISEITMQQFLESDLAWRLGLWQDSAAMEDARRRRSLDWTWTDDSGGRWGVSPEGVHLGSVTLPLPTFAPSYGAARERAFIDQELARGTAQVLIWETLEERAEAIRRRRDAERQEEARERARAGPRRTLPDTSGIRR